MSYYFLIDKNCSKKQKADIIMLLVKKKLLIIIYHNKEYLKENAKNECRKLSEEEKEAKREYGRNWYRNMTENEKNKLKEYQRNYLALKIKMSEKTLKFIDAEVSEKEFHASKQPVALNSVLINKIVVSNQFEHSDKGFKCFIDYTEVNIIRPYVLHCVKWVVHEIF